MATMRPVWPTALFLLGATFGSAAAGDWGIEGLPIGDAPGVQTLGLMHGDGLAAPDGAGGAYVAWQDERTLPTRIFLQRIRGDGSPSAGWPANGIPISSATPIPQTQPVLAGDGSGGVILAWSEGSPDSVFHRVRVLRIAPDGSPYPGWSVAGVVLTDSTHSASSPVVVLDGTGGAFVLWRRSSPVFYADRVYLHHVLPGGDLDSSWPGDGLVVGHSESPVTPDAVSDGAGGALLLWDEYHWPEDFTDLRLLRLLSTGAVAPGWPALGLVVRSTTTDYNAVRRPRIAPDGASGAVVAFREFKAGESHFGLYARRVLGNGQFAPGWADSGAPAVTTPPGVARIRVVSDGAGGAILAWEAQAAFPEWDVWVQRLDAAGSVASCWPAEGRPAGLPTGNGTDPVMIPDGSGGAFVGWTGFQAERGRAYLQHVTSSGQNAPGWGAGGAELAPGRPIENDQQTCALAVDGGPGVYAFWTEQPIPSTQFDGEVRGQHVDGAPTAGVDEPVAPAAFALAVHPTPAVSTLRIRFRLSRAAVTSVEVFDLAGRRVTTLVSPAFRLAGDHTLAWDLRGQHGQAVATGAYRIVLRSDEQTKTVAAVILR